MTLSTLIASRGSSGDASSARKYSSKAPSVTAPSLRNSVIVAVPIFDGTAIWAVSLALSKKYSIKRSASLFFSVIQSPYGCFSSPTIAGTGVGATHASRLVLTPSFLFGRAA